VDEPSFVRAGRRAASVSPSDRPAEHRIEGEAQRRSARNDRPAARASDRVPPGIVPMLLRTRPVASGPHFLVHARPAAEAGDVRGRLIVTAPKRVLRGAVERNAMRRVVREAWRAAGLNGRPVVALVRVRAAIDVSDTPGAGLPRRKRLAREELDRLFAVARSALDRQGRAQGRAR